MARMQAVKSGEFADDGLGSEKNIGDESRTFE